MIEDLNKLIEGLNTPALFQLIMGIDNLLISEIPTDKHKIIIIVNWKSYCIYTLHLPVRNELWSRVTCEKLVSNLQTPTAHFIAHL